MDPNIPSQPVQDINPAPQPDLQSVKEIPYSKSKFKLILLIAIIVVILVLGGGVYYFGTKQNKLNQQKTTVPAPMVTQLSPTPKVVNLNPNTGNLYNDIKVRLNQVLK